MTMFLRRFSVRIEFEEHQKMLATMVRDFLVAECPKAKVREWEEDLKKGYSPEVWAKMADLGWQGLVIPEALGGQGMGFLELAIVLEEMGRNILPAPYISTVIGGCVPVLEAGTEEQKKRFLPGIARGESVFTLALIEGLDAYKPAGIALRATPKGDNYVISGKKLFVEMAQAADYMVCVARTGEGPRPEEGITLFVVDARSAGIRSEVIPTMGMDKLCEVRFENVAVPKQNMLGAPGQGWPIVDTIIRKGAIAKCAESVGGMQACLDMCVTYSKERVQYERPIGAFQVLQHWMADMYIKVQTSKYLVYETAWLETNGMPCDRQAFEAKAFVNEAYKWLAERAVRLHGGIGTTRDHDIGLYFRRSEAAAIAFGGTDYHKDRVAGLMGLVRA